MEIGIRFALPPAGCVRSDENAGVCHRASCGFINANGYIYQGRLRTVVTVCSNYYRPLNGDITRCHHVVHV